MSGGQRCQKCFDRNVFGKALARGQGCQNEYLVSPHSGKEFPLMEAILGV